MNAPGLPARAVRPASTGWHDDRLGALALLAVGIPIFATWLFPLSGGCPDPDTCNPLPAFQLAIRGVVFFSAFWMPALAVVSLRSRKAFLALTAAAVALTLLAALMSSPARAALSPIGLGDAPIFPQFGIAFGIVGLLALADLARSRRPSA